MSDPSRKSSTTQPNLPVPGEVTGKMLPNATAATPFEDYGEVTAKMPPREPARVQMPPVVAPPDPAGEMTGRMSPMQVQGPATPFDTPAQPPPVAVDEALPFQPQEVTAAAVGLPAPAPFTAKAPPRQLGSPGVLSGRPSSGMGFGAHVVQAAPVGHSPPAATPPAQAPVAMPQPAGVPPQPPPAVLLQPVPAAAPAGAAPHEVPAAISPPPAIPRSGPDVELESDPSGNLPPPQPDPNPSPRPDMGAGASPWETTKSFDAAELPSAAILQQPPVVAEPFEAPAESPLASPGSRTAMTVGLAVAALALVGAIIYLVASQGPAADDPTNVKVGSEQREYGDDPLPSTTASATAKPTVSPKPLKPRPKPANGDIYEEGGGDDIYDGL